MLIRLFQPSDEQQIVDLWNACGLTRPWNHPARDIARKVAAQPELFFVGELEATDDGAQQDSADKPSADGALKPGFIVASAMAGYDGHRGWINYLAVHPGLTSRGFGRLIMAHAESQLIARGCPKINVQIRADNADVIEFYRSVGFTEDAAVSMGKRLIADQ